MVLYLTLFLTTYPGPFIAYQIARSFIVYLYLAGDFREAEIIRRRPGHNEADGIKYLQVCIS